MNLSNPIKNKISDIVDPFLNGPLHKGMTSTMADKVYMPLFKQIYEELFALITVQLHNRLRGNLVTVYYEFHISDKNQIR